MARVHALACSLLFVLPAAFAYPQFWVNEYAKSCASHPTTQEEHHGKPVPDKTTKYVIRGGDGKAAATLCPGTTYKVEINYGGQNRLSLTTASAGRISSSDSQCPGRFYTLKQARGPTATFNWAVPCAAAGALTLKTTSANGEYGTFQSASITMQVNAACAAAACKAARGL